MLSDRIKKTRNLLGFSQEEFADNLGVPYQTISKYERGKTKPASDILAKINNRFDINLNWLLTGKGDMLIKETNTLKLRDCDFPIEEKMTDWGSKRLRKIPAENKMISEDFAKKINVKMKRLFGLCMDNSNPTLEELFNIKRKVDVSIDWLLFGD